MAVLAAGATVAAVRKKQQQMYGSSPQRLGRSPQRWPDSRSTPNVAFGRTLPQRRPDSRSPPKDSRSPPKVAFGRTVPRWLLLQEERGRRVERQTRTTAHTTNDSIVHDPNSTSPSTAKSESEPQPEPEPEPGLAFEQEPEPEPETATELEPGPRRGSSSARIDVHTAWDAILARIDREDWDAAVQGLSALLEHDSDVALSNSADGRVRPISPARCLQWRGFAHDRAGRRDQALADFDRAILTGGSSVDGDSYFNRGRLRGLCALRLLHGAQEDLSEAVRQMPLHSEARDRLAVVTNILATVATENGKPQRRLASSTVAKVMEHTNAVNSSSAELEALYRLHIRELARETDAADDEANTLRTQLRRAKKQLAQSTKQAEEMRLDLRELRTFVAAQEERHAKEMNALAATNDRLLIRFRQARTAFVGRARGAVDASLVQSRSVVETEPLSFGEDWDSLDDSDAGDHNVEIRGRSVYLRGKQTAGYDSAGEHLPGAKHHAENSDASFGRGSLTSSHHTRRGIRSASARLASVSKEQQLLQHHQPENISAERTSLHEEMDLLIGSQTIAGPVESRIAGTQNTAAAIRTGGRDASGIRQHASRQPTVLVDTSSGRSSVSSLASDG